MDLCSGRSVLNAENSGCALSCGRQRMQSLLDMPLSGSVTLPGCCKSLHSSVFSWGSSAWSSGLSQYPVSRIVHDGAAGCPGRVRAQLNGSEERARGRLSTVDDCLCFYVLAWLSSLHCLPVCTSRPFHFGTRARDLVWDMLQDTWHCAIGVTAVLSWRAHRPPSRGRASTPAHILMCHIFI